MRQMIVCLFLCVFSHPGHSQSVSDVSSGSDGYRLKLESTIGVGSGCEAEKLSLPAGTHTLTVCLLATNTGDGTLYLHDIVSEQLGPLLSGDFYTLAPGQSSFYSYAVPVARSTGLVSRWMGVSDLGVTACGTAWSLALVGPSTTGLGGLEPGSTLTCPPQTPLW